MLADQIFLARERSERTEPTAPDQVGVDHEAPIEEKVAPHDWSAIQGSSIFLTLAILVVCAGTVALAWVNRNQQTAYSSPSRSSALADRNFEASAKINDMHQLIEHMTALTEALEQRVTAEQEEVKKLSERLAELTSRVEGLRKEPFLLPSSASELPSPPRVIATPRRKRTDTSVGPVSVGGAPLSLTTGPGDQQ